jgi:hypothetical protein
VGVGVGDGGGGGGGGAACTVGESVKQASANRAITEVSDLFFIGLEVGFASDFPVFPVFWEYAEMRTKALDRNVRFFLT